MKISTRIFATMMAAGAAVAVSAATPAFEWGNFFDGNSSAGDQNTAILADGTGSYWYNTLGTGTAAVKYGSTELFAGVPEGGANNNLGITKLDLSGNVLWTVYSQQGDVENSNGGMAFIPGTEDLVFVAKVRNADPTPTQDVYVVDDKGNKFKVAYHESANRYYAVIVGRVSAADGTVKWVRTIDVDNSAQGAKDNTPDGAYAYDIACLNGEIFIAGQGRKSIYVPTAAGTETVAFNCPDWDGTSQKEGGEAFLLALDEDGYFKTVQCASNEGISGSKLMGVKAEDGVLYLHGVAVPGTTAGTCTFLGHSYATGDKSSPFFAAYEPSTGNVKWFTSMKGEAVNAKTGYQNVRLAPVGNTLWATGMFNGKLTDNANAANVLSQLESGKMREGFVIKLDKNTGAWQGAVASSTGFTGVAQSALTGYMGLMQNPVQPQNIYVYGYAMNAAIGVFVREYDAATLQPNVDNTWTLMTSAAAASAVNMCYMADQGAAYFATRSNKAFTPMGAGASAAPQAWGVYASRFKLPANLGVEGISYGTAAEAAVYTVVDGGIRVKAECGAAVTILDLCGRTVAADVLSAGEERVYTLAPGLYIVPGHKLVVR